MWANHGTGHRIEYDDGLLAMEIELLDFVKHSVFD